MKYGKQAFRYIFFAFSGKKGCRCNPSRENYLVLQQPLNKIDGLPVARKSDSSGILFKT